jgi:hypothetical protein
MPRNGIAGFYGRSILSFFFLRHFHTFIFPPTKDKGFFPSTPCRGHLGMHG